MTCNSPLADQHRISAARWSAIAALVSTRFIEEGEHRSVDKEAGPHARFITFFSYTAESLKAMIERPSEADTARKAYKPPTA